MERMPPLKAAHLGAEERVRKRLYGKERPLPTLSPDKAELRIEHISLKTEDGGLIYADLYGEGDRGG